MQKNILSIHIYKPIAEVFLFSITPPNSALWIPGVVKEETSNWPVGIGTVYRLQNEKGEWSDVTVVAIKENEFVEWISHDTGYHCRYEFKLLDNVSTELTYLEWVGDGEIIAPFTQEILEKLKNVLENK